MILDGLKFKILNAEKVNDDIIGQVGEIVKAKKSDLWLQLKDGIINLKQVHLEGKKMMDAQSFINGNRQILNKVLK